MGLFCPETVHDVDTFTKSRKCQCEGHFPRPSAGDGAAVFLTAPAPVPAPRYPPKNVYFETDTENTRTAVREAGNGIWSFGDAGEGEGEGGILAEAPAAPRTRSPLMEWVLDELRYSLDREPRAELGSDVKCAAAKAILRAPLPPPLCCPQLPMLPCSIFQVTSDSPERHLYHHLHITFLRVILVTCAPCNLRCAIWRPANHQGASESAKRC